MADSAAVRKQKAAIKARGLKAGYSGSKSSVDATFRRKQERAKARGKSAAAHAKAPGQVKKFPTSRLAGEVTKIKAKSRPMTPGKASIRPIARPKAPSGPAKNIKADPIMHTMPTARATPPKTMPTGISTVQTSGIRAKAMAAKAMAAKPSKPNTPSGALAKPSRLGFSEKKADVTRIALKPGG